MSARHAKRGGWWLLAFGAGLAAGQLTLVCDLAAAEDKAVDFARDVRPILSRYCFKCHGPDDKTREGGLRLDDRESALKPADSGERAIVPQAPERSELVARILSDDADARMPPPATKTALSPAQKEILRQWIATGAEYRPHWAFVPPQQRPLPEIKRGDWPRNEVDRFVLARLEREGLAPSPEADPYVLLRRVSLDLVGLPPEADEVDRILAASREGPGGAFDRQLFSREYEGYVGRLLQSPHYGERWARRWLDLARYSDTNGYEKDRPRTMWPYRDWVIESLNADLPFDQFTLEQIAGDMLPRATQAQRVATGFHRNTMINEEGGIDPLEFRFYALNDRVSTTGTTWLGLTLGCAQCHTHKYDPLSHTEYYQLFACLNNADEPTLDVPTPEQVRQRESLLAEIAALEAKLAAGANSAEKYTWHTVRPLSAVSEGQAELIIGNDQAIDVQGPTPATDTYTITFESDLANVGAIRLEALTHNNLPSRGPGRTRHGNFVLSEFSAAATSPDAAAAVQPLKFARTLADVEQEGFPAAAALDGEAHTGWAIHVPDEKLNVDRTIVFYLAEPFRTAPGKAKWTITLQHRHGGQHTLGRFRLSLGERAEPGKPALAETATLASGEAFQKWLADERGQVNRWVALLPAEVKSNLPLLIHEGEGIVFAAGDQSKSDTYELVFRDLPAGATALRVEALPDERLPRHGPGRVYYEGPLGDFTLCNFTVEADGALQPLGGGTASFAAKNFEAEKALDADLQTGWSVNGGQGNRHVAVFTLAKPLAAGVRELRVKLLFERHYAAGLGKFRLWATSDATVHPARNVPVELEQILVSGELDSSRLAALVPHYVRTAPEFAAARKRIEQLKKQLPQPATALVMQEWPEGRNRPTARYHRGEFLQPQEAVSPGVPAFLPGLPPGTAANRLGLARWLVLPNHPLTGRVTVNRQWEAIFGRGLVRTSGDFGLQGELPSHPELLDWLAVEFIKRGWSLKELHRLLVTSATYRQASHITPEVLKVDPENRLLARGPRVRLEAELVRDSALAASGLLSRKIGGPSVFPPQPASVTTEGAYGSLSWQTSTGPDRYRRSLYTFSKRTAPFALYATFDAPSGEACVARRDVSNTPLQSLSLLHDEVFREASLALGARLAELPDLEARIVRLYRLALGRPPVAAEVAVLRKFYASQQQRLESGELSAREIAGKNGPEGIELAACTLLARVAFNLDEFVTRQ